MTFEKDIETAVESYLRRPGTDYAIMIDGEWGIGKTHLWENKLSKLVGKNDSLYISLYGLSSISDIEKKMFRELSLIGTDDNNNGSDSLFSGVLDKLSMSIDDVRIGGLGSLVKAGTEVWKRRSLEKAKKRFICFDDIERFEGNLAICLAYINELVEHDDIKCLVIGNSKEIKEQVEFARGLLKTIRYKYDIYHSPPDLVEKTISATKHSNDKAKLFINKLLTNENQNQLEEFILESKCSNCSGIVNLAT
jgi:hypothetical protein